MSAVQSEYSLWTRDPELGLLHVLEELGIGFVPYSPLGRGFLAGAFQDGASPVASDMRSRHPRFQPDALRKNLSLVDSLAEIAARKGATPGQLALAWLLARKPWIVPIPGTRKSSRLIENAGAVDLVLSPGDLAAIEDLVSRTPIEGARYAEGDMKLLNR